MTAYSGFVLTAKLGDWLVIRAGGDGRVEEVMASAPTLDEARAVAQQRAITPVILVQIGGVLAANDASAIVTSSYLAAVSVNPRCNLCGGPHPFDTTVPSPLWNRVIRAQGLPEYLCLNCIVVEMVRAKESLTAALFSIDAFPDMEASPVIEVDVHPNHVVDAILADGERVPGVPDPPRVMTADDQAALDEIQRVLREGGETT